MIHGELGAPVNAKSWCLTLELARYRLWAHCLLFGVPVACRERTVTSTNIPSSGKQTITEDSEKEGGKLAASGSFNSLLKSQGANL